MIGHTPLATPESRGLYHAVPTSTGGTVQPVQPLPTPANFHDDSWAARIKRAREARSAGQELRRDKKIPPVPAQTVRRTG